MEEHQTEKNYNTLKDDPESLLSLLNKYVNLKLIKNSTYEGFIHSIDPLTHSILLSVPKEDSYQTTLIPGHAILAVSELTPTVDPPSTKAPPTLKTNEEITSRKNNLIAWFKFNLLPVNECGKNIGVGNVNLLPPYSVQDIYAENPVVALQIRKIMERMPQDFQPI